MNPLFPSTAGARIERELTRLEMADRVTEKVRSLNVGIAAAGTWKMREANQMQAAICELNPYTWAEVLV